MSHKSKGRKNLRNREAYPAPIEPRDDLRLPSREEVEYADGHLMTALPERLWVGSGDSAHE